MDYLITQLRYVTGKYKISQIFAHGNKFSSATIITTHPPVLYYTVTHNVSGNGSELAFNTNTNEPILNEARHGGTYYISFFFGVNIIGNGKLTSYSQTMRKHFIM